MTPITIRRLLNDELQPAALLLSRAMRDNPIDMRAFGGETVHRGRSLERFYLPVLRGLHRRGEISGAFREAVLVGVCGSAPPGHCQATLLEKVRIFPAVIVGNQIGTVVRVLNWVGEWSRRDPSEPHAHLGPVAVEPALQGQGIGRALMLDFCARTDECGGRTYLETDKRENVGFYQQFGFAVVAEGDVLGVRNWFMSRPASGLPSQLSFAGMIADATYGQTQGRRTPTTRVQLTAFALCLALGALPCVAASNDPSLVGIWATGGDDSHVKIEKCGANLCGTIVWLKNPLGDDGKPAVDSRNPDPSLRKQQLVGLRLLSGFVQDGDDPNAWKGGTIYDPDGGRTYSCNITVQDRNTLRVRGYVGFSLLGKTQIWIRTE